jgi:hypothetical protein
MSSKDHKRGETWYSLCNTLCTTPVHDMAVHARVNELIIGTHGRNVFVLDINDVHWARCTLSDVPSLRLHVYGEFPQRKAIIT